MIYLVAGQDSEKTKALMEELKADGSYTITEDMKERLADLQRDTRMKRDSREHQGGL